MTIKVTIKHDEPSSPYNIRVHRVHFNADGTHAEDGVIIKPGEEQWFHIWGTCRLAIEEEYEVAVRQQSPEVVPGPERGEETA